MIKIVRAKPEHAQTIVPKDIFLDNPDLAEVVAAEVAQREVYALLGAENEVLALIGYHRVNRQTAEVWSVTSNSAHKYPLEFHRACISMMHKFVGVYEIKRMQIVVKNGYHEGLRWARMLGFEVEGLMDSYGCDGSDYLLLGRVSQ